MTFRFSTGKQNTEQARQRARLASIDLCLEARFEDGKVIQALHTDTNMGYILVYRESTSGRWLNSDGLAFNGLPRTPENLIRTIDQRDPVSLIYVLPAA